MKETPITKITMVSKCLISGFRKLKQLWEEIFFQKN